MLLIAILTYLFSIFLPPTTTEKNIVFNIIHNNKTVGELQAVHRIKDNCSEYENSTTVHTRIVKNIQVTYLTKVIFENDILEYSSVKLIVNGKTYSEAETKKVDGQYAFYKNGKFKKHISENIKHSSVMLLFEEPNGLGSIYSEENGNYYEIKHTGNKTYEKINSKGKSSIYEYENKDLKNMTVDAGLVTFDMILKDQ